MDRLVQYMNLTGWFIPLYSQYCPNNIPLHIYTYVFIIAIITIVIITIIIIIEIAIIVIINIVTIIYH